MTKIRMGEVFAEDSKLQHAAHMMAGAAMVFELIRIEMGGDDLGPKPTQEEAEAYRLQHPDIPHTNFEKAEQLLESKVGGTE